MDLKIASAAATTEERNAIDSLLGPAPETSKVVSEMLPDTVLLVVANLCEVFDICCCQRFMPSMIKSAG